MMIFPNNIKSGRSGEDKKAIDNGYDRIFGKRDVLNKPLKNKEEKKDVK